MAENDHRIECELLGKEIRIIVLILLLVILREMLL